MPFYLIKGMTLYALKCRVFDDLKQDYNFRKIAALESTRNVSSGYITDWALQHMTLRCIT